jgi:hypothetical protein
MVAPVGKRKYIPGTIALFELYSGSPVSNAQDDINKIPLSGGGWPCPMGGRVTVGRATRHHNMG